MSANGLIIVGYGIDPAGHYEAWIADLATPAPATFPLFATALAGLGLLGWHRKRKAKAVA